MYRYNLKREADRTVKTLEYERGISNTGNWYRMKRLFERAKAGEELTIGFLGGSITQGCLATKPELCYAYRVYEWWVKTFPQATFHYVNAGIGGTTSHFASARVEADLLSHHVDFAIVEFSVNDDSTEFFRETYEGVVRHVWQDPCKPAVMLVHNVYYNTGANAQIMHAQIGRHYDLPSVSMQSSIYPEVVAGRIPNRAITQDDLHPNDNGHELVASVIIYALEQMLENPSADSEVSLPAPLTENAYEKAFRLDNRNYEPVCDGFTKDERTQTDITDCFKNGWSATSQGAKLIFTVEASELAVQYRRCVSKPAPVALAIVNGDEANAVRLDANFDEDWGDKLELTPVLIHGEKKSHTLEIRLVSGDASMPSTFDVISVIGSVK